MRGGLGDRLIFASLPFGELVEAGLHSLYLFRLEHVFSVYLLCDLVDDWFVFFFHWFAFRPVVECLAAHTAFFHDAIPKFVEKRRVRLD